jgi:membrane protein
MDVADETKTAVSRLERFQAKHAVLGFPYAVFRKMGEDQTGNYAALISYYGFLSIFPLLLVLVSLLEIFLRGNPHLQAKILSYATNIFPTFGVQLSHAVQGKSVGQTGIGLIIGIFLTLLGARRMTSSISDALNHLWRVPLSDRSGFPSNFIRQIIMIAVMGVALIITSALTALGGYGVAASLILNIAAFLAVFRLGISRTIPTKSLIDSAVIAAAFWQILQALGSILIKRQLHSLSGVYGTFALVLGLMWWIYFESQITLLAVEIHIVRQLKLWPRSLTEPPLMPADKKVYTKYAVGEKRRPEQEINVDFPE